jgi:hypothetical protein
MYTASVIKMKIHHPVQVLCRRIKSHSYAINCSLLIKEAGS